jgi:1,5-anhydro-D-fructose reductase (1,5-anhydro-D-mannitol-forming)
MTLGWGVVSTGRAADVLVGPAINTAEGSKITAVYSRDKTRAAEYAARHDVAGAYTSYEEMLADPAVDVVYVASPNSLHYEQVVAAARAGKHVYCDKPLAMTTEEARRAVDACRDAGVKLGVNFQTRHYAANQEAKRLIDEGAIGDIKLMEIASCAGNNPLKGWRTDAGLAGMGAVNNISVHPLDLACYFAGSEVTEVVALTNVGRSDELETLPLVLLRFENGAMAYINGNQAVPNPRADMEVYGSEGRISGRSTTRPGMDGELLVKKNDGQEQSIPFDTKDGFKRAIQAFNEAIASGTEPNPSGKDGLRSVELVDAITRSAREGSVVQLTRAAVAG